MTISFMQITGILITLLLIISAGIYSGSKVKNAADFQTGGGKAGPFMVCGSIVGSLVSCQATMGTAQLAFNYGMAAWWYALGAGMACLFLALCYTVPLRKSRCVTELEIIAGEFGASAERISSILCSLGIFISILAQVTAGIGLITLLFPGTGIFEAAFASAVLMMIYVIFGGSWGTGIGGIIKLVLLYSASILSFFLIIKLSGGFSGLYSDLKAVLIGTDLGRMQPSLSLSRINSEADLNSRFFSLLARGPFKDIGSAVSLLIGVVSTQTYAQAVISGRSDKAAKLGAVMSSLLIPPLGAAGVLIGLYMRANFITSQEAGIMLRCGQSLPEGMGVIGSALQVFPAFALHCMPEILGGMTAGALLITVIGGGAGLSLGAGTILVKDIFSKMSKKNESSLKTLRLTIAFILAAAGIISSLMTGTVLNDLGFLSMGLRGSVVFVPMSCALFLPNRISTRFCTAAVILSPLAVMAGKALNLPFNAQFLGIFSALALCALGAADKKKQSR